MTNALKDVYNEEFIIHLAKTVQQFYDRFDRDAFINLVFSDNWTEKTLKGRMRHVTTCLNAFLPHEYEDAINILRKVAPNLSNHTLASIVFPDFVEVYGLEDWDVSLPALEWFTQYSTSEYAVRPFIQQAPDIMIEQMMKWSFHPNHHVRRLASEGIRPRLPWGIGLQQFKVDPTPIIPILTILKEDESLYVRKSVANNLNDISKDHPAIVLDLAKEWLGKHSYTDWIIKHACRGLLKKGNKQALSLFGFHDTNAVQVIDFVVDRTELFIGEEITFSFQIRGNEEHPIKIRVEYAIDFVKAKGDRTRRVFKITENKITTSEILSYHKSHSFKDLTTRKHYKGMHTLSVLINGEVKESINFSLK